MVAPVQSSRSYRRPTSPKALGHAPPFPSPPVGKGTIGSISGLQHRMIDVPGWIGLPELMVILVVVLLLFGPKRLPEMGRSVGRGMRELKESMTSMSLSDQEEKGSGTLSDVSAAPAAKRENSG
jgi:sec-independent protein translocase protein TatA